MRDSNIDRPEKLKSDELNPAELIGIEDRTFVCVGLDYLKQPLFWVLTYYPDLSGVVIWDV
jgi:hypothetical protein